MDSAAIWTPDSNVLLFLSFETLALPAERLVIVIRTLLGSGVALETEMMHPSFPSGCVPGTVLPASKKVVSARDLESERMCSDSRLLGISE